MVYVFADESGDLGFRKGSSRWFVFTLALVNDHRRVQKIVNKVRKELRKKQKNIGELHANREKKSTRKKILLELSKLDDLQIISVILDKEKVFVSQKEQVNLLYNHVANVLIERLVALYSVSELGSGDLHICLDRQYTSKTLQGKFESYLRNSIKDKTDNLNFDLSFKTSHHEKCIQAVDFISWAIFRKYTMNENEYYDIIKAKIIDEFLFYK